MMNELDYLEEITISLRQMSRTLESMLQLLLDEKYKERTRNIDNGIAHLNGNETVKGEKHIHKNAWVVSSLCKCLTSLPPQFLYTIYHYNDDKGLDLDSLNKENYLKIFFDKQSAIDYCEKTLNAHYETVDIPASKKIIIGDDYE